MLSSYARHCGFVQYMKSRHRRCSFHLRDATGTDSLPPLVLIFTIRYLRCDIQSPRCEPRRSEQEFEERRSSHLSSLFGYPIFVSPLTNINNSLLKPPLFELSTCEPIFETWTLFLRFTFHPTLYLPPQNPVVFQREREVYRSTRRSMNLFFKWSLSGVDRKAVNGRLWVIQWSTSFARSRTPDISPGSQGESNRSLGRLYRDLNARDSPHANVLRKASSTC